MKNAFVMAALWLSACGGVAPASEPAPAASTAGGEAEVTPAHPLRTTTPIPVPAPAIAREALSQPLQDLWSEVEETVAIRPPDGPAAATEEALTEWAEGPFAAWVTARREALAEVVAMSEAVPEEPAHERAMAAALLGYALEELVAGMRGAPVPTDIASDAELLEIYVSSLSAVLRPLASDAVVSYAYCQQRLMPLGDESEWLPWRAYCVQRGREVIEVYELIPPAQEPTE
jgi:hypothetical protein